MTPSGAGGGKRNEGGEKEKKEQEKEEKEEEGRMRSSVSAEDTTWVHRFLPGRARSVYVADDPSAKLTVPENKGREAMAYLSRPRDDYVRWRDWLLETPLADDLSGRVFEYLWHSE
ncbi:hypothetical protein VTH06DRAFT_3546 [Thermothelomyces fergusii]